MKAAATINAQRAWGGKIAAYLFLSGSGAGVYLAGFLLYLFYPDRLVTSAAGAMLGAPLVIIGILLLIWDLGKKRLAFLAFSRPGVSWISRGIIIVTVFLVLALLHVGAEIWPFTWLGEAPGLRLALGGIASLAALLTLVYTGLALGAVRSVPSWSPVFLPLLFTLSGVSTGIMLLACYLSVQNLTAGAAFAPALAILARGDAAVIIIEAVIIGRYLSRRYRAVARGDLAMLFWAGVVAAGLALPFALEIYLGCLAAAGPVLTLVLRALVGVAGLGGGFMLRYVVIAGGTGLPLNVNGVTVAFPVPRIKAFR